MEPSTRQAGIDWNAVQEKVTSQKWALAIVDALESAFDGFVRAWPHDPPRQQSEWSHHYFCDDDASRLLFDLKSPNRHVCPHCGRVYSGHPWDGAWRTLLHGTVVGNVERAAILARIRPADKKYSEYVRKIALFYAEHYAEYPVHGVRAGKGKIMSQCLDESIMVINLGRAFHAGRGMGWISDAETNLINEKYFKPSIDLLKPQIDRIHNIHAWMLGAIATAAQHLGDKALLDWTIDNPVGFTQQLKQGTNDDGFWFEGSIGYHNYTCNALFSHAFVAGQMGRDVYDQPKFSRMLSAPLGLVYPNGIFPAHNDCWPGGKLSADLYEIGAWAWPEESFKNDLGWICRLSGPGNRVTPLACGTDTIKVAIAPQWRTSMHALLFGAPTLDESAEMPARHSRHFTASGIGILESGRGLRVCVRSGPDGGGHDHRDKLNIDVFAADCCVVPDVGTSGYGAKITNEWYKTAAAHTTIVIDGKRQEACDGRIDSFADDTLKASVDGTYPGVRMQRQIRLVKDGWEDKLDVVCDRPRQIDYFFHALGSLQLSLPVTDGLLGEGHGYAWLREVKSVVTDGNFTATWQTPAGVLTATIAASSATTAFTSTGDDNPKSAPMGVLILRRTTTTTCFAVTYRLAAN